MHPPTSPDYPGHHAGSSSPGRFAVGGEGGEEAGEGGEEVAEGGEETDEGQEADAATEEGGEEEAAGEDEEEGDEDSHGNSIAASSLMSGLLCLLVSKLIL